MARKLRNEDLLIACLTCKSQREIAKELGVTTATVNRRIHDPTFQKVFSEHRKKILDGTSTELVSNSQKAVEVLVKLLDSENELMRYNAASKILHLSQDYITQTDIIQRLDRLEQLKD